MFGSLLPAARGVPRSQLISAANACDAAAQARSEQEEMAAMLRVMQARETIQVALLQAQARRYGDTLPGNDRTELVIDGDSVGWVEARIPEKLAFQLLTQKNFGQDGLLSDEGMRDLHKGYRFTKTRYVSRRVTVPVAWRGGRARRTTANFARNTLNLKD